MGINRPDIEELKRAIISAHNGDSMLDDYRDEIKAALNYIAEQEKRIAELEADRRWIAVSERLPEIGEEVLVYSAKHGGMHNAFVERSDRGVVGFAVGTGPGWWDAVSHWKPLDEAPQADTQTEEL